jgi:hypothetical protein
MQLVIADGLWLFKEQRAKDNNHCVEILQDRVIQISAESQLNLRPFHLSLAHVYFALRAFYQLIARF